MKIHLYEIRDGRYALSIESRGHIYGYIAESRPERARILYQMLRTFFGPGLFYTAWLVLLVGIGVAGWILTLALRAVGVLP